MKRILFILSYFLYIFTLVGCPSPYSNEMYYNLQLSKENSHEVPPPPVVEEEPEDPGEEGGSGEEEEDVPVGSTLITMFEVLQPDGTIDEELLAKFSQDVQDKVRASLQNITTFTTFTTDSFKGKLVIAKFSAKNVPDMNYVDGIWDKSSDKKYLGAATEDKYVYSGDDTTAGTNNILEVQYHMYDGKNPFYSPTGLFNTTTYGDKTDTIMNRFIFYRFTGKGGGVAALDNMLVAVDAYTGLVFVFAKPTKFKEILGIPNPILWEAVEVVATADDGKKYKFYEYDPAGYIAADGQFVLADWYVRQQEAADYDPPKTDKSPYLHRVVIAPEGGVLPDPAVPFTPIITATTLEDDGVLLEETEGDNLGKYYTDITFPEKEFEVNYELYIREGELGEWSIEPVAVVKIPAKTTEASKRTYRHYDALILTDLPQYYAKAMDTLDDTVELGNSKENPVIGSRMLTEREMLLATINTIGVATNQLWYTTGSADGDLSEDTQNGTTSGTYLHGIDRHCFTSYNYRHYMRFDNYKDSLVTLNGAFMKNRGGAAPVVNTSYKGIWLHNDTSACDDSEFAHGYYKNIGTFWKPNLVWIDVPEYHGWPGSFGASPLKDKLTVSFEEITIDIVLSDIWVEYESNLGSQDGNKPIWKGGSFSVTQNGVTTEYDKDSDVPFGFFMDAATFRDAIGVGYTQK